MSEPSEWQLKILITGFGPFKSIDENPSWLAVKQLHGTTLDLTTPIKLEEEDNEPKHRPPRSGPSRTTSSSALIQTLQVPVHYGSVLDLVPRIHGGVPTSTSAHFWHDERLDPVFGGQKGKSYPDGYPQVCHPSGERDTYDVVIHVGVGKTGSLRCETQAHKTGYNAADANHCLAPIVQGTSETQEDKVRGFGQGYEDFQALEQTKVNVADLVSWLKDIGMGPDEVQQSMDPGRYVCDYIFYCSLCQAHRSSQQRTDVLFVHVPPTDQDLSVTRSRDAIRAIAWYMASYALKH